MYKYKLSVLAMFKNESMIIKEWLKHYILEGVEHFYLIDNGSTDNYEDKIKDYMNMISLEKDKMRLDYGTQSYLYQKIYFEKIKKETKWIIIVDIDEYIYSRNGYENITDVLENLSSKINTIWIPWKIFGSNNHKKHPENIIDNFTRRSEIIDKFLGYGKTIARTEHLLNFGCCGHYIETNNTNIYTSNGDNYYLYDYKDISKLNLHLNHYMLLSEEYYTNNKLNRGGGESGKINKYTIEYFRENDLKYNTIEDNELSNKKIEMKYKYSLNYTNNLIDNNTNNIFKKYLKISNYYMEFGTSNLLLYANKIMNIKNIISITCDYENYTKYNEKLIGTNKYINFYINNENNIDKYMNYMKILNNDILNKLDLIYINDKYNTECCILLYRLIDNKCKIIINNNSMHSTILDLYKVIEQNEYITVLQKK